MNPLPGRLHPYAFERLPKLTRGIDAADFARSDDPMCCGSHCCAQSGSGCDAPGWRGLP